MGWEASSSLLSLVSSGSHSSSCHWSSLLLEWSINRWMCPSSSALQDMRSGGREGRLFSMTCGFNSAILCAFNSTSDTAVLWARFHQHVSSIFSPLACFTVTQCVSTASVQHERTGAKPGSLQRKWVQSTNRNLCNASSKIYNINYTWS